METRMRTGFRGITTLSVRQPSRVAPARLRRRIPTCIKCSYTLDFRYPGDHKFDLSEYMVVLEKPIGLTLAPDPTTGQILVQSIQEDSPADTCRLVQVGDQLISCSAVFGEDMWQCSDLRRVRWAINNRNGKVKLVLSRAARRRTPLWYSTGKPGGASSRRDTLQLPVNFCSSSPPMVEDWIADFITPSRMMHVTFHRTTLGPQQGAGGFPGTRHARLARAQRLRDQLSQARLEEPIDLACGIQPRLGSGDHLPSSIVVPASQNGAVPFRRSGDGRLVSNGASGNGSSGSTAGSSAGASSNSSAGGGAGGGIAYLMASTAFSKSGRGGAPQQLVRQDTLALRDRKVLLLLPWMLVGPGELATRDLAHVASMMGLGRMLQLQLTCWNGRLYLRGTMDPVEMAEELMQAEQAEAEAAAAVAAALPSPGSTPADDDLSAAVLRALQQPGPLQSMAPRLRGIMMVAAALQRLVVRQHYMTNGTKDGSAILITCEPYQGEGSVGSSSNGTTNNSSSTNNTSSSNNNSGSSNNNSSGSSGNSNNSSSSTSSQSWEEEQVEVGLALAAWFHWYGGLGAVEAIAAVDQVMDTSLPLTVLEEATTALSEVGADRLSRKVLTWRYGGLSAHVSGALVGGWSNRVAMRMCSNPWGCRGNTSRGHFFLEMRGLPPGTYTYKYIVDGTWTIDPHAPKVLDSAGNWNNVLEVEEPGLCACPVRGLHLARWEAGRQAFSMKMRPSS